jgi:tol-pal system protein YbgF
MAVPVWFLSALLLLVPSCITTQEDILYLNDQIRRLDARVNGLEKSIGQKMSLELASVRDNQAETGAEMEKIKAEVQRLSGRVEDNRELVRRAVERDTTEEDEIKTQLADIRRRLEGLETRLGQVYEYLRLERGEKPPQPEAVTQEGPERPPPASGKAPVVSEKGLYDETLGLYKQGQYEEAIGGFKGFLKRYPKSDLADNAQFWIGECHMALRQYEQAILAYQVVIKDYARGNKVPNAMLRQALAFYEIKDKTSARLLLNKIIKNYPNSNEAKIAKVKLKSIE